MLRVLGRDVGVDVLIEELEDQRYAVGKHELLSHVLKLENMVDLEMLQQKQEYPRNGLDDDLLMPVHVDGQLH